MNGRRDIKTSVINATTELITEIGINDLTTAKIAERSRTAETVIYRHFKNKQDVINKAISFRLGELHKEFETINNQPLPAILRLENLLDAHLSFNEKTKGFSRVAFSDQLHLGDRELKEIAKSRQEKYEFLMIDLIRDGIKEGVFRPDLDTKTAAQSYIGLIYFVMHKWSFDDFSWDLLNEKERMLQYWTKEWK
ncbi:MAG: transcriptional regulator, TetR family [Firmicutes bacterium]|nr:transcriptional regulator, TetR family [Bacillota bacterium]